MCHSDPAQTGTRPGGGGRLTVTNGEDYEHQKTSES